MILAHTHHGSLVAGELGPKPARSEAGRGRLRQALFWSTEIGLDNPLIVGRLAVKTIRVVNVFFTRVPTCRVREVNVERFVPISNPPPNLKFPPDLCDRIRLDAENRRLIHEGFMSKAEFDRLCALSDDWNYRRPLEELFRLCSPDEGRKKGVLARLFSRSAN
jgi:hypothetical protein